MTYSRFIEGLKAAKIALDRKVWRTSPRPTPPRSINLIKMARTRETKTKAAKRLN